MYELPRSHRTKVEFQPVVRFGNQNAGSRNILVLVRHLKLKTAYYGSNKRADLGLSINVPDTLPGAMIKRQKTKVTPCSRTNIEALRPSANIVGILPHPFDPPVRIPSFRVRAPEFFRTVGCIGCNKNLGPRRHRLTSDGGVVKGHAI